MSGNPNCDRPSAITSSSQELLADPSSSNGDLQAAFQKFLKKKKRTKQAEEKQAQRFAQHRSTEAFRQKLRELFVERIRHYIGVPYAKRYHQPEGCSCEGCTESGRQLYHDPLFLDCCALIRRVVADLRYLFGFRLGKGNQAYQYDTLPMRVGSVEELQPGDLIFWSGEYFKPRAKRQVFDMTHVEVFIGGKTGKAVIGSRQQHKWVMEYDTYEFTSKTWKCKEIFFCKIDTWLAGVCDPAHPELWKTGSRAPAASAKSIFYDYGDRDSKASHQSCGHAQEMASTVSMNDTGCSSGDGCNPEAVKDLSTSSHEATVQGQLGSLDELFELHEGIASEAESSDDEPSEAAEAEMAAQELVQAVAERAGGCLVIV